MTTLMIELNDNKALSLIKDLEDLKLLRIIRKRERLSDVLLGSVSDEQAEKMHDELNNMRTTEWDRSF